MNRQIERQSRYTQSDYGRPPVKYTPSAVSGIHSTHTHTPSTHLLSLSTSHSAVNRNLLDRAHLVRLVRVTGDLGPSTPAFKRAPGWHCNGGDGTGHPTLSHPRVPCCHPYNPDVPIHTTHLGTSPRYIQWNSRYQYSKNRNIAYYIIFFLS